MYKIIRRHGEGKTKELIRYACENDAVIITHRPLRITTKAEEYHMPVKVMDINSFHLYEMPPRFVVDDVDFFLKTLFKTNLVAYSCELEQ